MWAPLFFCPLFVWAYVHIVQTNAMFGIGDIGDERIPKYFQGERVINFINRKLIDGYMPDERPLLNKIREGQVREMAFSFDPAYSIVEVEAQFADVVIWYWADPVPPSTKSTEEVMLGDNAYGFRQWQDAEESAWLSPKHRKS